jgi:hypothetical protein
MSAIIFLLLVVNKCLSSIGYFVVGKLVFKLQWSDKTTNKDLLERAGLPYTEKTS